MPLTEREELELLELEEEEARANPPQPKRAPSQPILNQIGSGLLSAAQYAGEKIDRYTGAPMRAGTAEVLKGSGLLNAGKAAASQFGQDPSNAPTDADIGALMGFSKENSLSDLIPQIYSETGEGLPLKKGGMLDPSSAGAAGFALNTATDPMNLVPVGKMARMATRGAEAVARPALKGAGQVAGLLKDGTIKVGSRVGEAVSGVPRDIIENYVKRTDKINNLISKYGEDVVTASDDVRNAFQTQIRNTRQGLNKVITDTLSKSDPGRMVDVNPIIGSLEKAKSGLNPALQKAQISELDELIGQLKEAAPNGQANSLTAYQIAEKLNEVSKGAYQKGGQMFMPGDKVQKAAKMAANDSRKLIKESLPEIAEANSQLSRLHRLEELMNKNLIAPGKPEGALIAAGSSNNRGAKLLSELGKLTKTDMVGKAKDLATQKAFTKPGLLPQGPQTGFAVLRPITGAALGSAAGPVGAIGGALFASPVALKAAINAGNISADVVRTIVGKPGALTSAMIEEAVKKVNGPNGDKILRAAYMGNQGLLRQGKEDE